LLIATATANNRSFADNGLLHYTHTMDKVGSLVVLRFDSVCVDCGAYVYVLGALLCTSCAALGAPMCPATS